MRQETLKGKWHQLKGKIKEKWGKLTDDDLEELEGHEEQLLGKIQEKYGYTKEQAQKELNKFEKECGCKCSGKGDTCH